MNGVLEPIDYETAWGTPESEIKAPVPVVCPGYLPLDVQAELEMRDLLFCGSLVCPPHSLLNEQKPPKPTHPAVVGHSKTPDCFERKIKNESEFS